MNLSRKIVFVFIFSCLTTKGFSIEFYGQFIQGHFIVGKTSSNSEVKIDKKKVKVSEDGYFVFGLDRDRKFDITINLKQGSVNKNIIKKVLKRKYNIQRIDGLDEKKVTPPEEVYKRIKDENKKIGEARAINSDLDFFKDKFIMPVEGIISGVYGSQRILNGKPRRPHYGVDFHAPEGTPVKSMMSGVVVLAEKDMYFTGGTIIFDHGHGISTLYMHMKDISVRVGEKVRKGQIVGTLGQSGRATGPHLDIRLNWFDVKLDPLTILN